MMRSFIILLLLIVVFLAGMLIGIEREESIRSNHISPELNEVEQIDQIVHWEAYEEQSIIEEQMLNIEGPEHTTQKLATFLESGVKGFYEIIVDVLFELSSLFI